MKSHPRNSEDVVGSGPFKVTEFKPGEYIILERYEDYFIPDRPYLDKIVFQVIPEASSHVTSLENEEVHMAPTTSISLRDTARLNELEHLVSTTEGYEAIGPLNWLAFNTEHEKLGDKRVRQAICYAIDRDFINNVLHVKQSIPATGPIVPGSPFYAETANRYDIDLEKSKALLAEAGVGDGLELTIDYFPCYEEQQKLVAEYLRAQLKKVGITVNVRASADFPGWAERISNWEFELTMDNVYNWGDPVIGVHRTYLCDNQKKGVIWSNTQRYCNPRVDGLLAEAGVTLDQEQRQIRNNAALSMPRRRRSSSTRHRSTMSTSTRCAPSITPASATCRSKSGVPPLPSTTSIGKPRQHPPTSPSGATGAG